MDKDAKTEIDKSIIDAAKKVVAENAVAENAFNRIMQEDTFFRKTDAAEYSDSYRNALADLLEKVNGKDEATKRSAAAIVAELMNEEPSRPLKLDGKDGYAQAMEDVQKKADSIVNATGSEATKEVAAIAKNLGDEHLAKVIPKEKSSLSAEDRMLNAMAGLVEDAKESKNEDYKRSIANSAASITESVQAIKESKDTGKLKLLPNVENAEPLIVKYNPEETRGKTTKEKIFDALTKVSGPAALLDAARDMIGGVDKNPDKNPEGGFRPENASGGKLPGGERVI